ncbi:hypothetical protein SAMN05216456_1434 [Devosia crocina]|uniref:Uncharacterized protein n=1 Tax=Devosia crocina TaxID=429728 RepID=A0A1I7NAL4_9HYPH|nr:hypothetical protein [Devosia crocina]SFV31714.1 hypothetical protein SAMN05216456_1434 [Devosia crocina]
MYIASANPPDLSKFPGFVCFKSSEPIHYPRRWQRDALIQAALDPTVTAVGPLDPTIWMMPDIEFAFRVTIATATFSLVITELNGRLPVDRFGHAVLKVRRSQLTTEPLHSTARAIWAHKRTVVDPLVKYLAVEAAGSKVEGIAMQSLLQAFQSHRAVDPFEPLLAMLAQGVLVGDLSSGFHGHTMFRPGPSYEPRRESIPSVRLTNILTEKP